MPFLQAEILQGGRSSCLSVNTVALLTLVASATWPTGNRRNSHSKKSVCRYVSCSFSYCEFIACGRRRGITGPAGV